MHRSLWIVFFYSWAVTYGLPSEPEPGSETSSAAPDSEFCSPLVIGHRGASGYVPEHTLGSYALAIVLGADYIEPDLVITSDKQVISRHENELSVGTDVTNHPEFASRRRTQNIDGNEVTGWFTEDFTLAELKTLRVVERIPDIRPGNARLNGAFQIVTFQEIIDLAKSLQVSQNRVIGLYPEIKHSTHFRNIGLPLEQAVVDILHQNGYKGASAPVYIQSFEVNNLKELKNITQLRLLQLFDSKSMSPYDQVQQGSNLTYGAMATPEGLREVATYAYAVGPDKSYIIPRDENNNLGEPTTFVADAHAAGLKVHPYTFRAENNFLPAQFQSVDRNPTSIGNFTAEIQAFFDAGVDGLFSDQPDIPARTRSCTK
ncbi:unnamed protein product [Chrysodeixis includens]|uniref:glycerophosphodiester phosphodiesterase n=1 Tax=Chrysodeixis includens TaxID=689277 RepID=A0A9P0FYY6_CHRIL|nr:unnamed protein product [Chrysodeixis includens]